MVKSVKELNHLTMLDSLKRARADAIERIDQAVELAAKEGALGNVSICVDIICNEGVSMSSHTEGGLDTVHPEVVHDDEIEIYNKLEIYRPNGECSCILNYVPYEHGDEEGESGLLIDDCGEVNVVGDKSLIIFKDGSYIRSVGDHCFYDKNINAIARVRLLVEEGVMLVTRINKCNIYKSTDSQVAQIVALSV